MVGARGVALMMKHLAWIAAAGIVLTVAWLASAADKLAGSGKDLSPLKVDKAAPLLLDEPPAKAPEAFDPEEAQGRQ